MPMLVLVYVVVGLFCIIPCTDSFVKVDLRTVSFDIPPQEVRDHYTTCGLVKSRIGRSILGSKGREFMSYQQCTRFRTTLDFDREYIWNRSSNRQAENGVINCNFFPHSMKSIWWTLVH